MTNVYMLERARWVGACVFVASNLLIRTLPLGEPFTEKRLQIEVWRFLWAVVVTVSVLIGLPLWAWTRELWREGVDRDGLIAGAQMTAMGAFGAWLFNSKHVFALVPGWPFETIQALMAALIACCVFWVALPCSIWMTTSIARFGSIAERSVKSFAAAAEFQELSERAQTVGRLGAFGIATATLPIGAWRRLAISVDKKSVEPSFPSEFVILFGLYWSLILAIGYLPVYLASNRAGSVIRSAIAGPYPADPGRFSEWRKNQAEIDAFLGIGSATEHFKLVFAVIAPLAGAILSTMVGGS